MVTFIREQMRSFLETVDVNCDSKIDKYEFKALLLIPAAVRLFTDVGVDVVALVEHVDVIFKGGKAYDYADIVNLMLDMRGTNTCTVKDIVDLRQWIAHELSDLSGGMEP